MSSSKIQINSNSTNNDIAQVLNDYIKSETTAPFRIPISDPHTRHRVHSIALDNNLIAASELNGVNREVIIWKGREKELVELKALITQFSNDSSSDLLKLPPMSFELRYVTRLLARNYNIVGNSEGLGTQRHSVLYKAVDKQNVLNKLREFTQGSNESLQLPPMDADTRRFAALTAADLGLYPITKGIGKDRQVVVHKEKHVGWSDINTNYLRNLFTTASGDIPEYLTSHDIRGALENANLPEFMGTAAIKLANNSPNGQVSFRTLCKLVDVKEKEFHTVFKAFDNNDSGTIKPDDIGKMLKALDLSPSSKDFTFLKLVEKKANSTTGLSYDEFKNICCLLDLKELSHVDPMSVMSEGYISKTKSNNSVFYSSFATGMSGAISNAFSRTVVAPLERVRLQMNVDPGRYRSIYHCMSSIVQEEGVRGLWRGNLLNVIRIAPQGAIAFLAKDGIRYSLPDSLRKSAGGLALASSLSGMLAISSVYSLDLVRLRMTTRKGLYPSISAAFKQIYKEGGIYALHKGMTHSIAWSALYYGIQFFSYDTLKNQYLNYLLSKGNDAVISVPASLCLGSISGMLTILGSYPLESVRRKLQLDGLNGTAPKYSSYFDCFGQSIKTRTLYNGMAANLLKTPLTVAITFATYETLMNNVFKARGINDDKKKSL